MARTFEIPKATVSKSTDGSWRARILPTRSSLPLKQLSRLCEEPRSSVRSRRVERDRSLVDQVLRIFFNVLKTLRAKGDLEETIQALYQAAIGQATGDADKLKGFQHRVKELASIPSLVITAKALGVLAANANTFCRARTVSEVRPIFTEDALSRRAVIVHQLGIIVHSGPKLEENQFFVTMDADDLEDLKHVITRALDKNKEIVRLMQDRVQLLTENP